MMDEQDFGFVDDHSAFPLEGTRPVDRPAPVGQQLVDAWRAEHGDEAFPE